MANIDYKKSFEKLVKQIKLEKSWAEDFDKDKKGISYYNKGMLFAYESILELAEKLEKGTFFEEDKK